MTDYVSQHHATYRGDTERLVVACNAGSGGSFVVYSAPCLADVRFTRSVGPFFDAPVRVRFDDGAVLDAEFTGGASFAQRLLDANKVRMGDTDGQCFAEISVLTTGKAVVKRTLEACRGGADN